VVVESGNWQFYGLVVDLQLGATDPRSADEQSEKRPCRRAWPGCSTGKPLFTNLVVLPSLMMERGPDPASPAVPGVGRLTGFGKIRPLPVKTIPAHHARSRLASAGDVAEISWRRRQAGQFLDRLYREQATRCASTSTKLVQRSSGISARPAAARAF